MRNRVDHSAMVRLFEEIRQAFPHLAMDLDHEPAQVDLEMNIRQQAGLDFDVSLNLQGDELHLSAGAFWLSWFPCTRPEIVEAYRDAVHGLLGGAYRIREHSRGGRVFRAELQRLQTGEWQTIGTSHGWAWPFPRGAVVTVLQNGSGGSRR
ncbi:MAG TPA: hypothetical protein VD833_25535 [Vicinamibacterales bacterium]|nr:hypothetical protein [Vicinamibacterales bacterium]